MTAIIQEQVQRAAWRNIVSSPAVVEERKSAPHSTGASAKPVHQLQVFPTPDSGIARRTGFVREYYLLIETAVGTVYHISAPCDFVPSIENVCRLAGLLEERECVSADHDQNLSIVGYMLETTLRFVKVDLAAATANAWPLRSAAMQVCCDAGITDASPQPLGEQVNAVQQQLAAQFNIALDEFVERLDHEILALAPVLNGMQCAQYNHFARAADPTVRRYRLQSAKAMPVLTSVLCAKPSAFTKLLTNVVDTGQPLAAALSTACRVRLVTAKHALTMPASLVSGGEMSTLTTALDSLVPDRFPRTSTEWDVFRRLACEVIPNITGRAPTSPLNCAILAAIARRGWVQAERELGRICVDGESAAQFRELLNAYRKSLSFDIIQSGIAFASDAVEACNAAIEETLGNVGVLHLFAAANIYPRSLVEVQRELYLKHEIQRGLRWHTVIQSPTVLEGCAISAVETADDLVALGRKLTNCLASLVRDCVDGGLHVFSIQDSESALLGAAAFRFTPGTSGMFDVKLADCKGHHNCAICEQGHRAVEAFTLWLRSEAAQDKIAQIKSAQFARWRCDKKTIEQRIAVDLTATALELLPHRTLRFSALRRKVLERLNAR